MGKLYRFRRRGRPINEYQRRKFYSDRPKAYRPKRSWPSRIWGAAIAISGFAFLAVEFGPPLIGCNVKGNVSYSTGERIFHVPGQEDYWATRISLFRGERWFCSEASARAAGWRRAVR